MNNGRILVFSFIVLISLLSLGFWQIYRYNNGIIIQNQFEKVSNLPQMEIDCNTNLADLVFRKVQISGTLFNQLEQYFFYGSIDRNGIPGYFILTPLTCSNGGNLLVNRGWVAKNSKKYQDRQENIIIPQVIEGIIVPGDFKKTFAPIHEDNAEELVWLDIDFINKKTELNIPNYYILQTNNHDDNFKFYPLHKNKLKQLPHLQYSIVWFSLALIWCIITFIALRKNKKK